MCIEPVVELENQISSKMNNSIESSEESEISFSHLLELAANNDVEGFKKLTDLNPNSVDEVGLWYGPRLTEKGMVLEHRTVLMVAAMYGSLDVMEVILSLSKANVNRSCGLNKVTALHFAAFGVSVNAIKAVKLLLAEGADPNVSDSKGNRPFDLINNVSTIRASLEDLLSYNGSCGKNDLRVSIDTKKEYPVDPSLPDIKNSIYSTDEFRMYSFKIRPCSRAYSHDWTECPFVHPGENARRRDPRKFHYSCVPCPDFRKGSCRRGDMCEYAHGVFECWLHPAQYRTRLCKDGTACYRRVCFFAHIPEELRPLYPSVGSAVLSPRSVASGASVMDMAAAMSMFSSSPSGGGPHSPSAWRLRSSLNARDFELELEQRHIFNDMSCLSPRRFSPSHNSAVLNHFQQQNMLLSPVSARLSALSIHEKQQQMRSLSARDLGANLIPDGSWSNKWESSAPDWSFNAGDELKRLERSNTVGKENGEEPDLSWVQSLVKDSPSEIPKEVSGTKVCGDGSNSNSQVESVGQSAWGMA